jgi:hypothetical protein
LKKKFFPKKIEETQCWWLTAVILAIQEADIKRIQV